MSERVRPLVEGVRTLTMLVRDDDGAPQRSALIVDWGDELVAPHPAGDNSEPVLSHLFRDGWALAVDPDQSCPLLETYHVTLDGLSATVFGPGEPPRIRLMNLSVTDGQWPDVSWVQHAREQGVVRIMVGNIGLSTATENPGRTFEAAVAQGRVAVADIPLQAPATST